jgi:hypothetical protein
MLRNQMMILTGLFLAMGWLLATGTGKTQWVRLVDILIYGPYLIYLSQQSEEYVISDGENVFLLFLGATTITYNLRNYLRG